MFTTKKTQLFQTPEKQKSVKNSPVQNVTSSAFVNAALNIQNNTLSENGAVKLKSTLDPFVDQFGQTSNYLKLRSFAEIEKDCETLWALDPLNTVKFAHFLRTIPRKVSMFDGSVTEEPQKGSELKHESIMRMIWLSTKSPETFWSNIVLFISLGSWHDVFTMLQTDLIYNGWENKKLDWKKFGDLIFSGLNNTNTVNLVKKYLPQVKTRSVCKSVESQANCMIAKWICSLLFGSKQTSYNYKLYRQLKTSGSAHEWQKLISQKRFSEIKFDQIHGRALNLLVKSKFLKNQNLTDQYSAWIKSPETKDVKYTGFVHDLFGTLPDHLSSVDLHVRETINKQFSTLVEKAKSEKNDKSTDWIVVRDTSGSMESNAIGTKISSYDIAKSIALYFSEFLSGRFANSWIEFNSDAKLHSWKGQTPIEKWFNDDSSCVGSTDFQSVIDLFVTLKKTGISESEFPKGILCISDGEFNPSQLNETNVQTARKKLLSGGFSEDFANSFQIVLWNIPNSYYGHVKPKFETTAKEKGSYYFSGYSPSIISFLNGHEIETPRQLFDAAMNQQILNLIEVKV
jgi:hypothetical protein